MKLLKNKKFEFLEHTSDAYVVAYGKTLEEAFENAALAMFEVMTDTKKVEAKKKFEIKTTGFDLFSLLYNWLEELLFIYSAYNMVLSKFKIRRIEKVNDEYQIEAEAYGELFDSKKHEQRTEVKAVTYSLMDIKKENGIYKVKVLFDI